MICVVSRLDATSEYEPFCFASQLCSDVCLDSIIKVLRQMHSHVQVGCTQNTFAERLRTLNGGEVTG